MRPQDDHDVPVPDGTSSGAVPSHEQGDDASRDEATRDVAEAVERLTGSDRQPEKHERHRLLGTVLHSVGGSVRSVRSNGLVGSMVNLLENVAPHLRVRDLETLRAHHHGLTGEALADSLVETASRASVVVGAAGGALSAVEYAAPPALLSAPVQIAAETVLVAAVEVKLIAELHEVYGVPAPGTSRQRALAYLQAWGQQRGVSAIRPGSVGAVLGAGARRELRQRLLSRLGRNLTTLGPLLTGAVAGGYLNRRGTKHLAEAVRTDLRGRSLDLD